MQKLQKIEKKEILKIIHFKNLAKDVSLGIFSENSSEDYCRNSSRFILRFLRGFLEKSLLRFSGRFLEKPPEIASKTSEITSEIFRGVPFQNSLRIYLGILPWIPLAKER